MFTHSLSYLFLASNWPPKSDAQTKLLEDDELDGAVTFYILHSLEPSDVAPVYVPRGTVTIHSLRNDPVYSIQGSSLSIPEIEQLKKLAVEDDIYRVKISFKPDDLDKKAVSSFTKACSIYESGLTDIITIAVDQSGLPVGVSISASPPYCIGADISDPKLNTFNTTVNFVSLVNGPAPDTLTYIQRLEQEKAEKARGEQGDNRSFFAKYWMYIVPFLIFLFISGATGPEAQGGGR
ncbi:ER membrane protein complex subunit 10-like isoform X2 [Stegodyphus dumicola]|uniref:ER membrane protein complex subunit 10-like isoform X2 n=1 Tax=Stegodyphus dumicola TaxID=202533 RepID=UPI0015B3451D|nr:ER membrane protein complex subunit 10-like isoform X2 [Stegodyphus dumicola]